MRCMEDKSPSLIVPYQHRLTFLSPPLPRPLLQPIDMPDTNFGQPRIVFNRMVFRLITPFWMNCSVPSPDKFKS